MTLTIDDDVDRDADLANGVARPELVPNVPTRKQLRTNRKGGAWEGRDERANNTSVKNNWNNDDKSVYAERRQTRWAEMDRYMYGIYGVFWFVNKPVRRIVWIIFELCIKFDLGSPWDHIE